MSAGGGADDPEACRLFVHGLPPSVDDSRLHDAFEPFQGLVQCNIAKPGLGSVTFSSAVATERALERMDGTKIDGAVISVKRPRAFFIQRQQEAQLRLDSQKLPRNRDLSTRPRPAGGAVAPGAPPQAAAAVPLDDKASAARAAALSALAGGAALPKGMVGAKGMKAVTAAKKTGAVGSGKRGRRGDKAADASLVAEATAQVLLETSAGTALSPTRADQQRLIAERVRLLHRARAPARRPQGWIDEDAFSAEGESEETGLSDMDEEYDRWGRARGDVSPEGIRRREKEGWEEEEEEEDVWGGYEREEDDWDAWEDDGSTADGAQVFGDRWDERPREDWNRWRENQDEELERGFVRADDDEEDAGADALLAAAAGAVRGPGRAGAAPSPPAARAAVPLGTPLEPELASILDMDDAEFDLMFGGPEEDGEATVGAPLGSAVDEDDDYEALARKILLGQKAEEDDDYWEDSGSRSLSDPFPAPAPQPSPPMAAPKSSTKAGSATVEKKTRSATLAKKTGSTAVTKKTSTATDEEKTGSATDEKKTGSTAVTKKTGSTTVTKKAGSATVEKKTGSTTVTKKAGSATVEKKTGSATVTNKADSLVVETKSVSGVPPTEASPGTPGWWAKHGVAPLEGQGYEDSTATGEMRSLQVADDGEGDDGEEIPAFGPLEVSPRVREERERLERAAELLMTGNAAEYEEVMREAKLQGKVDRRLGGNLKPQQDKDLGVGAAAAQATPDEPEARQQAIEEQLMDELDEVDDRPAPRSPAQQGMEAESAEGESRVGWPDARAAPAEGGTVIGAYTRGAPSGANAQQEEDVEAAERKALLDSMVVEESRGQSSADGPVEPGFGSRRGRSRGAGVDTGMLKKMMRAGGKEAGSPSQLGSPSKAPAHAPPNRVPTPAKTTATLVTPKLRDQLPLPQRKAEAETTPASRDERPPSPDLSKPPPSDSVTIRRGAETLQVAGPGLGPPPTVTRESLVSEELLEMLLSRNVSSLQTLGPATEQESPRALTPEEADAAVVKLQEEQGLVPQVTYKDLVDVLRRHVDVELESLMADVDAQAMAAREDMLLAQLTPEAVALATLDDVLENRVSPSQDTEARLGPRVRDLNLRSDLQERLWAVNARLERDARFRMRFLPEQAKRQWEERKRSVRQSALEVAATAVPLSESASWDDEEGNSREAKQAWEARKEEARRTRESQGPQGPPRAL